MAVNCIWIIESVTDTQSSFWFLPQFIYMQVNYCWGVGAVWHFWFQRATFPNCCTLFILSVFTTAFWMEACLDFLFVSSFSFVWPDWLWLLCDCSHHLTGLDPQFLYNLWCFVSEPLGLTLITGLPPRLLELWLVGCQSSRSDLNWTPCSKGQSASVCPSCFLSNPSLWSGSVSLKLFPCTTQCVSSVITAP